MPSIDIYGYTAGITVPADWEAFVEGGGTAVSVTLEGINSELIVSSGGVASVVTMQDGALINVESGGIANDVTLEANNNGTVQDGGTLASGAVDGFSKLNVFGTGTDLTASGTVSGILNETYAGQVVVGDGGVVDGTTVYFGGFLIVSAFGFGGGAPEVSDTIVNSGGEVLVYSGVSYIGGTVNQGGSVTVLAGGETTGTTVDGGYELLQFAGSGVASGTIVQGGGTLAVSSGTSALDTMVFGGGLVTVQGGLLSGITVHGGNDYVYTGGVASHTQIDDGGVETVWNQGLAVGATIFAGGIQSVTLGANASGTRVESGGDQFVWSGAAHDTVVSSGGAEVLLNGGAYGFDSLIGSGGYGIVSAGGSLLSTTLYSGGTLVLFPGGSIQDVYVETGGSFFAFPGANVSDLLGAAGQVAIYVAGAQFDSDDNTLQDLTLLGGSASGTNVGAGETEVAEDGLGSTIDTTVSNGGVLEIIDGATASGTLVGDNGTETVSSSGEAIHTTVTDVGIEQVKPSGGSLDTVVSNGGLEDLSQFATASGTTISFGGSQFLTVDATASDTTVLDGGTQTVFAAADVTPTISGGKAYLSGFYAAGLGLTPASAISATVDGGGYLQVFIAAATSTTVGSGGQDAVLGETVSSAPVYGSASDTTVEAGGTEALLFNGVASNAAVDSGGAEFVFSGGSAVSATISSGGTEIVFSGGSAAGTTVDNGGGLDVLPGGNASGTTGTTAEVPEVILIQSNTGAIVYGSTATDVVVSMGWMEDALFGGTAISTTDDYLGADNVLFGGIANDTTIGFGGTENVSTGGTANFTTVSSGGFQYVSSGGVAIGTNVSSGGSLFVGLGGMASAARVTNAGQLHVTDSGTAISSIVNFSGYEVISQGGTAEFTRVNGGAFEYVSVGGTAISTTVNFEGSQFVSSGGIARFTTISLGGIQDVDGDAVSAIVASSGFQDVYAGGGAHGTIVDSAGTEAVYFGGKAVSAIVNDGGTLGVSAGGQSVDAIVNSGGTIAVGDNGVTTGTKVLGGFEAISSGGVASKTLLSGGQQSDNGSAIATTVGLGGNEDIGLGGVASGSIVNSGGNAFVLFGAQAIGATVNEDGTLYVSNGGVAEAATVNAGGLVNVGFGAGASATILNDNGIELVDSGGSGVGTTIGNGALEAVSSGGVANDVTVQPGGALLVFSGGSLNGSTGGTTGSGVFLYSAAGPLFLALGDSAGPVTLSGQAIEFVLTGGTAASATVTGGGQQIVNGGTASDTIVDNGGSLYVSSGGSAVSATIASGGSLFVTACGTASQITIAGSAYVDSGGVLSGAAIMGFESVSGGLAISNTVISGGFQVVTAGGTAIATTVEPGGEELVASGGVASNTVVEPGGTLIVEHTGQVPGVLFSNVLSLNGGTVGVGAPAVAHLNGITVEGPGTLLDQSTLTVDNETLIDGATLVVDYGAVASLNGDRLFGGSGAVVIDPSGTFALLGASGFQTGGSVTITNDGLFEAEAGNSNIDADFINANGVTVVAGTLAMADSYSDSGGGGVTLAAGTEIAFNQANDYTGDVTGPGTVSFSGGGTIGSTFVLTTPTLITANTLTFDEDQVFNAQNGVSDNLVTAYRAMWILNGHTVTFGPSLTATFGVASGNGINVQSGGGGGEIVNEASIALDGDTFGGVTLLDEGLATLNGGGVFGGGTITVAASGTIDLLSGSAFQAGASQQLINDGLFEETAGDGNIGATFTNGGSVVVTGGTLSFANGFTGGGFVSIAAGAEIAFDQAANYIGVISGSGTADFQGGGTFAPLLMLTVPTIEMGGTVTFSANETFNAQNGVADWLDTAYRTEWVLNGHMVTFGPSLTATFGVASGNGINVQSGGGGGEIVNEASIALDGDTFGGVTLLDAGLATLNGGGVFGGGTITVAASGTIDLLSGSAFQAGASQQLINDGLFEETAGNGNIGATFTNGGSVVVAGGTLSFANGFTGGGFVSIAAGAEIAFDQANTYASGAITGAGSVLFDGGTIGSDVQFAVPNVVLGSGDLLSFLENITFSGSLMTNYRSGFVLNGATVTFGSGLAATFGVPSGYGLYIGGGGIGGEVINQTSIAVDGDTIDGVTLQDQNMMTLAGGDNVFVGGTGSGTIGVTPGATFSVQAGGNVNQNGLIINNAGLLREVSGPFSDSQFGAIDNTGSILVASGTMTLHDSVSGIGGAAIVDPGATLELGGAFNQALTLTGGAGATPLLDSPGDFTGTIYGIGPGDAIAFHSAPGNAFFTGSTLVAVVNGSTYDYALAAPAIGNTVSIVGDTVQIECFAAGTRIATPGGPVPVEDLTAGHLVSLAEGGSAEIIRAGWRHIDCAAHPNPELAWPVRIARGAFAPGVPSADLYLSPGHAVFVDQVLVPARLLLNGTSICQAKWKSVTYHHVELPWHAVILAEGLAVESYLDVGNREAFHDNSIVRLFPEPATPFTRDAARVREMRGVAPLVMSGPSLAKIRNEIGRTRTRAVQP